MDEQTKAPEEVMLLKHGQPLPYRRCVVCDHFARKLSTRGWCWPCEAEFAKTPFPVSSVSASSNPEKL